MNNNKYFKENNKFFKLLRFLNLMEPNKTVISLSKLFFYVSIWIMIFVVLNYPENIAAIIGSSGANVIATLNYMYRRQQQGLPKEQSVEEVDSEEP